MSHTRVQPRRHIPAQPPQHLGRLFHPLPWNMRIHIAASQENRRPRQRASIIPWRAVGTDQPTAQSDHAAVSPRVACRELQRQARALREPQQHRTLPGIPAPAIRSSNAAITARPDDNSGSLLASGARKLFGYHACPLACGARKTNPGCFNSAASSRISSAEAPRPCIIIIAARAFSNASPAVKSGCPWCGPLTLSDASLILSSPKYYIGGTEFSQHGVATVVAA